MLSSGNFSIFVSFFLALIFSSIAQAENAVIVPVVPYGGYYYYNQNQIKDFDDDFFNKKPQPKTSISAKGQERYYGDDSTYSSLQRAEWIEKCQPEYARGNKAFRKCFELQKKQANLDLNNRIEEVNRRSSEPLRNQEPKNKEESR